MKICFLILIFILLLNSGRTAAQDDFGFRFVRIIYDDVYRGRSGNIFGGFGRGARRGMWATDYPIADLNFHEAIKRITKIYVTGEPLALSFNDPKIFEYPFVMITEPGYWLTNDNEVKNMQKYLARGGFLLIDDFHDYPIGTKGPQWFNMYNNIKQVFPDREPVRLDKNHPIWHIYYDINPEEAPSTKPGFTSHDCEYYGISDDKGRMMVFISYCQDIGDGWEWPDRLAEASTQSFQMGINILIYALTH
jgi:hypothetical protein